MEGRSNREAGRRGEGAAQRWVAHVDMDAFFASVEQLDKPELRGLPLIVGNSPLPMEKLWEMAAEARKLAQPPEFIKGLRGVVASASYEARAFGVHSAMPLSRALVLCPHAQVLPGRFDRYRAVAEELRRVWGEFSPLIEPLSLDEAYLDMTGCELAGGPIMGVGERLKERIKEATGLTASVGLASSKLMSKIASDMDKPDGLVVVRHGEEARILAPLPVRALPGVGPRTAESLYALGINTVGQLAIGNENRLAALFGGDQAASLLRRAVGIDPSPVEPPGDPKSISRETTLAEDLCDMGALKSILLLQCDRLAWQLRSEGFRARCVSIKLRLLPQKRTWTPSGAGFGRLLTRQVTLKHPTDSGQEMYAAVAGLLDAAARATGLGEGRELVRLIGVGTANLVRVGNGAADTETLHEQGHEQGALELVEMVDAPGEGHARDSRLNASLDTIRGRFGFSAITPAIGLKRHDEDDPDNLFG